MAVLFYLCSMDEVFVNKVSESGLITLDLEEFYPKEEVIVFDMKDYLFMGLILSYTFIKKNFNDCYYAALYFLKFSACSNTSLNTSSFVNGG